MKRPPKKDIKALVDKLKDARTAPNTFDPSVGKLSAKKSNRRIRKQGI